MGKLSPGTLILGIFALLFALVGAYAVKKHLGEKQVAGDQQPTQELLSVPMASMDLPTDRTITNGDLVVTKMTRKQAEEQGLTGMWMTNSQQIIGRTVRQPLVRGETFDPSKLYPQGLGPNVARRLKPGQRAVTIPYDDDSAEANLIMPDANVDVLFRSLADEQVGMPEATISLLQGVKVLAVNHETFSGAKSSKNSTDSTVTLSVTPQQAAALKVVEDRGSLMLVLRPDDEVHAATVTPPKTLPELMGIESQDSFKTEIYRRGRLTTTTFDRRGQTISVVGPPPELVTGQPNAAPVNTSTSTSTSVKDGKPCCGKDANSVLVNRGRQVAAARGRSGS
jgi:Flp pilus assembly protein CpaB